MLTSFRYKSTILCWLFNDAYLGYTVSSDRATDDGRDLEGNRRCLTQFLSRNFPGGTENKTMNTSVRMTGVRAQIRTVCFPSTIAAPVITECNRPRGIMIPTDHKACQLFVYNLVLSDVKSDVVQTVRKAFHVVSCLSVTQCQIIFNVDVGDVHQKFCSRQPNFGPYWPVKSTKVRFILLYTTLGL
jgi:hypothetical protein